MLHDRLALEPVDLRLLDARARQALLDAVLQAVRVGRRARCERLGLAPVDDAAAPRAGAADALERTRLPGRGADQVLGEDDLIRG
jgi:hypothetical protein